MIQIYPDEWEDHGMTSSTTPRANGPRPRFEAAERPFPEQVGATGSDGYLLFGSRLHTHNIYIIYI